MNLIIDFIEFSNFAGSIMIFFTVLKAFFRMPKKKHQAQKIPLLIRSDRFAMQLKQVLKHFVLK